MKNLAVDDCEIGEEELFRQWENVQRKLKSIVGETAFRSWLKELRPSSLAGGCVIIPAPTKFARDWIASNYADKICAAWKGEASEVYDIEVIVGADGGNMGKESGASGKKGAVMGGNNAGLVLSVPDEGAMGDSRGNKIGNSPKIGGAKFGNYGDGVGVKIPDYTSSLDKRFTFENFVVGKTNELAFAAARRVAESEDVTFNPLFLYGGVGLGKTHLMHALAWEISARFPQRRVLYLSAEKFMYQFVRALRFKDTMSFKEQFRSVDVLMIDDVQFISGKDSTQEEFFHTFNALVDQNRQIVISADKSPTDLEGMEERLKSRLGWGLVTDIHPTTYELRLGILQAKAELQKNISIPDVVLEFLAHRVTSNVRELEGALNRLMAHVELVGRPVTLETAQELLVDLLRANDRRVTVDEIKKRTAEHFNIRVADMHSARRTRAVARPRQIAMYLTKQLTHKSLPEIGRDFGGRDHTTVMHAVKKVEELSAREPGFAEDVELLRRALS